MSGAILRGRSTSNWTVQRGHSHTETESRKKHCVLFDENRCWSASIAQKWRCVSTFKKKTTTDDNDLFQGYFTILSSDVAAVRKTGTKTQDTSYISLYVSCIYIYIWTKSSNLAYSHISTWFKLHCLHCWKSQNNSYIHLVCCCWSTAAELKCISETRIHNLSLANFMSAW